MSEYKLEPAFGGTYTSPQQQGTSQCTHPDLEAQLAEAKAVLKLVEAKMMGDSGYCHACECDGHAPDCRLAKVLE